VGSAQQRSIHLDLRCSFGAVEAVDRGLDQLDSIIGARELDGLRGIVRTLVSAVPPYGSTAVSLELWAAEQFVHLTARYRSEGPTRTPPDLHPGAFALVVRCASSWVAERTTSETAVKAALDRRLLATDSLQTRSRITARAIGVEAGQARFETSPASA
jgi:hypothetical protein